MSLAWEQPEPEKLATRELTLVESPYGFACGCKACEWFHPLPSVIPDGESPIEIVQLAFDAHDCQHYDYKPSHICLSRIRQQPRWSIPRKFSAYLSYRTTNLRKF